MLVKRLFSLLVVSLISAAQAAEHPPMDHQGADLWLSDGDVIWGVHENIGLVHVPSGARVSVKLYHPDEPGTGSVELHAEHIVVEGTLDASESGYTGGGGAKSSASTAADGKGRYPRPDGTQFVVQPDGPPEGANDRDDSGFLLMGRGGAGGAAVVGAPNIAGGSGGGGSGGGVVKLHAQDLLYIGGTITTQPSQAGQPGGAGNIDGRMGSHCPYSDLVVSGPGGGGGNSHPPGTGEGGTAGYVSFYLIGPGPWAQCTGAPGKPGEIGQGGGILLSCEAEDGLLFDQGRVRSGSGGCETATCENAGTVKIFHRGERPEGGLINSAHVRYIELESAESTVPDAVAFTFANDDEGWTFVNPTPEDWKPAAGQYNPELRSLDILTSDQPTFALWESPLIQLAAAEGPAPESDMLAMAAGELYRATFHISTDVTPHPRVPIVRVRSSSESFERSDVLVITSGDTVSGYAPTPAGKPYVHYFLQPEGQDRIRLDFDVMTVDHHDDAIARLSLGFVLVESLGSPAELDGAEVAAFDFREGEAHGFTSRHAAPLFAAPERFEASEDGLLIQGRVTEKTIGSDELRVGIFGYWGLEAYDAVMEGGRLYRSDLTVRSTGSPESRTETPVFRMRINSESLRYSAYMNIDPRSGGQALPTAVEPQTYAFYFAAPPEVDGEYFIFSFDYVYSPEPERNASIGVVVEELRVTKVEQPTRMR